MVWKTTFTITLSAIVLITGWRAAIKAIIIALVMVNVILAKSIGKESIVLGLSIVFSNTLTILAILGIYTWPTAISTIKVTIIIVGQVMAKTISDQWICDSHICSTALANTFRAMLCVHARSTTVSSIKVTMQIIGVVMAVPISNKSSQLALWKNLSKNRFEIKNKSGAFFGHFLPWLMHPEIVSGMGMARNNSVGTDSPWLNVEIEQFLFKQLKR
jgi:hypothetical protein